MRTLKNPFITSSYESAEYFCDREQESRNLIREVTNGNNLALISTRRMGKTGLIRHAFYRLKEQQPDIDTFYLDIYSTQSLGDFVRLFASTVLGQLDSASQKALSRISKFVRSCRPVFTFDELTGVPKVTIDVAPAEEENTLKEIFEYLGSSEKRCYVAIDEFQQIVEYPEKGVEALLRSYIQFLPNVNFIFAGSKQHQIQEMFTSSRRPFYQSTQPLTIGPIQRDEYASFATGHFAEHNVKLHQEVFNSIYEKYEGHTWYVQCLLNRLYGYDRNVDMELVSYATEQILSEYSYMYADLLKTYSFGQVRLLKAIAREGCVKEVLAGDFISAHKLRAASSVSASLKKLLDNELIYRVYHLRSFYERVVAETTILK